MRGISANIILIAGAFGFNRSAAAARELIKAEKISCTIRAMDNRRSGENYGRRLPLVRARNRKYSKKLRYSS